MKEHLGNTIHMADIVQGGEHRDQEMAASLPLGAGGLTSLRLLSERSHTPGPDTHTDSSQTQ